MDLCTAAMIADGGQEADEKTTIEAWQLLIDTGVAWQLQGSLGRAADRLIERGVCHAPATNDAPLFEIVEVPGRTYVMCLRHPFVTATWEIAPGTYACDECQRAIRDQCLADEGVSSAFHNPRGFIREPDGNIAALK